MGRRSADGMDQILMLKDDSHLYGQLVDNFGFSVDSSDSMKTF